MNKLLVLTMLFLSTVSGVAQGAAKEAPQYKNVLVAAEIAPNILYGPILDPGPLAKPSTKAEHEAVREIWSVLNQMEPLKMLAWFRGEREQIYIARNGEIHCFYKAEDGLWRQNIKHLSPEKWWYHYAPGIGFMILIVLLLVFVVRRTVHNNRQGRPDLNDD